ncbi:metalloreductase STEAP3-like [Bombina bombina]|uniref:metalloreductase STEAP3-like n=1 Tax=Bombina bombina TaxID=8345 RepID=UPI00235A6B38|nr:metalloreductase STEAP3-like [Bombina bombina]
MLGSDMAKPLLESENGAESCVQPLGQTIGILGTGDFARSLTTRLLYSGFKVVVGSRNPKRSVGLFPADAEVMLHEDVVTRADVFFVALYREHFSTLSKLSRHLAGKILVDVSNNFKVNRYGESNAEYLASLFPQSTVVKGFNVVSAWALQSGPSDGNKQVLICSDNIFARNDVASIARSMGFIPVDMGALYSAREIENIPLRLLPFWKIPVVLGVCLFCFFYMYNFIIAVLHPYKNKNKFYKLPIELMNVTLPCVAYVLLSLVYLPGILAAFYQLHYNTKYRRFPDWLDQWLLHRKQIGLVSFFFAALHAVYSLCLPMRRAARYLLINDAYKQIKQDISNGWVEEEVWRMELYVSAGILAFGVLSILAVTSIPSVTNSLNWREFTFIQSKLGFAALVISTLHTLLFGWKRAFDGTRYKFYLPPTFTLTLLVPFAVILAKIVLLLPCVDRRLLRIRRGWEKNGSVKFHLANNNQDLTETISHL